MLCCDSGSPVLSFTISSTLALHFNLNNMAKFDTISPPPPNPTSGAAPPPGVGWLCGQLASFVACRMELASEARPALQSLMTALLRSGNADAALRLWPALLVATPDPFERSEAVAKLGASFLDSGSPACSPWSAYLLACHSAGEGSQ